MRTIDLNADMGEECGDDAALAPLVSSINAACGGHAGSAETMRVTAALAARHGAALGAHPSYPDRARFGRARLALPPAELRASLAAQIDALRTAARDAGCVLSHVKPHGALYNDAARDPARAALVAEVVRAADPALRLYGPPGSALERAAAAAGLAFVREGFADRAYRADGTLVSRGEPGAVLHDPVLVAARAVRLAAGLPIACADGSPRALPVDTLCLHGDTPGAVTLARAVREALVAAGFTIARP